MTSNDQVPRASTPLFCARLESHHRDVFFLLHFDCHQFACLFILNGMFYCFRLRFIWTLFLRICWKDFFFSWFEFCEFFDSTSFLDFFALLTIRIFLLDIYGTIEFFLNGDILTRWASPNLFEPFWTFLAPFWHFSATFLALFGPIFFYWNAMKHNRV